MSVSCQGCIVNYRYQLEERIVEAIEQGEFEKACLAMKELQKGAANLRFISDSFRDQLAGAAVTRTMIRFWAKRGGLSAVLVDSISQGYPQWSVLQWII